MGAADPTWPVRPPELNDAILKAGAGVGTYVANEAAWTALGASHHAEGVASSINTAVTSASWVGVGGTSSAATVTMLNAAMHGLAGWVDVKPAVVTAAVSAFMMANGLMRPAPECEANRAEWQVNFDLNPLVLGMLTPVITALDTQYFGVMWPNNAAVGTNYGATLNMLAASLTVPPPPATPGASPAAPAAAAGAGAESAAEGSAGAAMRASYQGAQAATSGAEPGGAGLGQVSELGQAVMGPAQQAVSSVGELPSKAFQAPSSLMSPAQSMFGMFANPGAFGANAPATVSPGVSAATPAVSALPGSSVPASSAGPGGMVPSSYTRPVSAFEAGAAGRPVGLRPSGALGVEPAAANVARPGGGVGGMPVAPAAAANALGARTGDGGRDNTPRAKVV